MLWIGGHSCFLLIFFIYIILLRRLSHSFIIINYFIFFVFFWRRINEFESEWTFFGLIIKIESIQWIQINRGTKCVPQSALQMHRPVQVSLSNAGQSCNCFVLRYLSMHPNYLKSRVKARFMLNFNSYAVFTFFPLLSYYGLSPWWVWFKKVWRETKFSIKTFRPINLNQYLDARNPGVVRFKTISFFILRNKSAKFEL